MTFPFVNHIGAQILESASGDSLVQLDTAPHHLNSQGMVHGGALFTLADTGMGAALYSVLQSGERCSTIEVKINYFKPVLGGTVVCKSTVIHRSRSYAALESTLFVEGFLVAKASGTFAVLPAKTSPPLPGGQG